MAKRILFLYGAPDSGHAQAASALIKRIRLDGAPMVALTHSLSESFPRLGPVFTRIYQSLVTHKSGIWDRFYDNAAYHSAVLRIETQFYGKDIFKIADLIRGFAPDAMFATQAWALRICAWAKREHYLRAPLYALVTDLRAHRYWALEETRTYFVAHQETKEDLESYGVLPASIEVTGIPTGAVAADDPCGAAYVTGLGFDASRPIVLVMGGSHGLFPYAEVMKCALGGALECQWLFVFGRNARSLNTCRRMLKTADGPAHIRCFGFLDDIVACMRASKVIVSKAGGLTVSQALCAGNPILLWPVIGGQEARNVDFLIRHNAAYRVGGVKEMVLRIATILSGDADAIRVAANMRALARPDAAKDIVRMLCEGLGEFPKEKSYTPALF
ncbi:MAG: glycosyltransferase [Elusimicrobiota bacterium]